MKTTQSVSVYDPKSGCELLTAEQAAGYLGYHYASFRRLVSEGMFKKYTVIGKTLLFLKSDILRFQSTHAWAASKAGLTKASAPTDQPPRALRATVNLSWTGNILDGTWREDPDFSWEKLPLIKADINADFGDVDFDVTVESPDGGSWRIKYYPETPLGRMVKKAARKIRRK